MSIYDGQGSNATGNTSQTGTINTTSAGASHSTTTDSATGSGTSLGAQNNVYTPGQQGLQGTAINAAQNFLQTGNLPGTFGAPPQVTQAYIDNWKANVAPEMAAQYGAGSPALSSSLALGLEQLQAQVYQNQSANFSGALGQAANIGYTAVGNTSATNQNQSQSGVSNTNSASWQNQNQTINMANAASNIGISMPTN